MSITPKSSFESIKSLLDDESPIVREAIISKLKSSPDEAQPFIREVLDGPDPLLAKHAQEISNLLGWDDVIGEFLEFIRSQRYELETGWFLLDRTVYTNFQPSSSTLLMDKIADRVRELIIPPLSSRQKCAIINRVLFHEYGFRGAGKNFENPENSSAQSVRP